MSVRTRTLKLLAPLAASGLLLCVAQATVGAQRATVTLRATDHSASVRGAVISLLSQDGRTVAEALSIENGTRTLEAPVPGTYRIRVRRIGYVPFVSQPVVLAAGQTARINLELPLSRVNLATMHIRSTFKACGGGFTGDQATSATWDQIRTALSADVLTERDTLVKLNVRHFVTRERPNGEPYALEVKELGESGAQPFGTADPATLSRAGYVVRQVSGTTYWAPDPHVLLSPEFEREHCFRLITRHDSAGEQIGLAFEPTSDRDLADIRGTLWVRRADSHLQRLEYRYANTSPPLGATDVGGDVEFTSLPSGVWYIASWSVRLPLITDNPIDPSRPRFVGYKSVGGVATPVGTTAVLPLNLRSAPPTVVV
ncbi:MAG TPA: carboxypeptidase-like regulatory domain-containing protein, partial [Gemmatimonadaceae bacterium]